MAPPPSADEAVVADQNPDRRTYDPPRLVHVLHEADGRWYRAAQFEWVRWPTGEWRAGVRYTTGPRAQYIRSVSADQLIAGLDSAGGGAAGIRGDGPQA
jgi:hypothetical protein